MCLRSQRPQHCTHKPFGRGAECRSQRDQFLTAIRRWPFSQRCTVIKCQFRRSGERFLREPGALSQLEQGRGNGTMFPLELLGDPAGHAAMFKGRALAQQNVVIAETVPLYSRGARPAPQPAAGR